MLSTYQTKYAFIYIYGSNVYLCLYTYLDTLHMYICSHHTQRIKWYQSVIIHFSEWVGLRPVSFFPFFFICFYSLILLPLTHSTVRSLAFIMLTCMCNPRMQLSWESGKTCLEDSAPVGVPLGTLWSRLYCFTSEHPSGDVVPPPLFDFHFQPGGQPLSMEFLTFSVPPNIPSTSIPRSPSPGGIPEHRCPKVSRKVWGDGGQSRKKRPHKALVQALPLR